MNDKWKTEMNRQQVIRLELFAAARFMTWHLNESGSKRHVAWTFFISFIVLLFNALDITTQHCILLGTVVLR
jgi:hypothetical protein